MNVLINRFSTIGQKTGIGHYTAQLLRCLLEQAPTHIACFPTGLAWRIGDLWGKAKPLLSRVERQEGGTENTMLAATTGFALWHGLRKKSVGLLRALGQAYLGRQLRQALASNRFDLYHEPNHIPLPCDHPTITTIHDLSVLLHPEWHPRGRVAYFEKHFVPSLGRSRHFLAVSDFTRRELIETLGIASERVTRVHNGIRPDLKPLSAEATAASLRKLGLPPRYLLHVGTIEPRKNLLTLLRAFCSLPDKLREACPLLLVGSWGWSSAAVAEYFHAEGRQRGVLHVGYLPDEQLPAVYNGARALVYPSLYEGFGLPPVEMLACGGAVLASTAGAVAEVVGRQARLIDAQDEDGWRRELGRVMADDDWLAELRRGAVEAARRFTWDRCATETLQAYRRACADGEARPNSINAA